MPQTAPSPTGSDLARRSLRGQVVDILIDGPATMRGLAVAMGVDIHAVNGALFALRNDGIVRVRGSVWNPRRFRREHHYVLAGATR